MPCTSNSLGNSVLSTGLIFIETGSYILFIVRILLVLSVDLLIFYVQILSIARLCVFNRLVTNINNSIMNINYQAPVMGTLYNNLCTVHNNVFLVHNAHITFAVQSRSAQIFSAFQLDLLINFSSNWLWEIYFIFVKFSPICCLSRG